MVSMWAWITILECQNNSWNSTVLILKIKIYYTHLEYIWPYIQINHIYSIYSFTSTNMQSLSTTFELKWCINKKTPIFSQSQKHHIPLILNHEMCYKSDERWEEQDPNIQRCWIEMRESRAFTNLWSKWARTSSTRAKNSKNNWAEWLGRGGGEGG